MATFLSFLNNPTPNVNLSTTAASLSYTNNLERTILITVSVSGLIETTFDNNAVQITANTDNGGGSIAYSYPICSAIFNGSSGGRTGFSGSATFLLFPNQSVSVSTTFPIVATNRNIRMIGWRLS